MIEYNEYSKHIVSYSICLYNSAGAYGPAARRGAARRGAARHGRPQSPALGAGSRAPPLAEKHDLVKKPLL